MNYNGVYIASGAEVTMAAGTVIELQLPAGTLQIEILRAWISAAIGAAPVDLVQEIEMYTNDAVATSGTSVTARKIRGSDDATTSVTILRTATIGGTPTEFYPDAFHQQNGWLFVPVPEERPRLVAGTTEDNWGIRIPTLRGTPINSFGVIWGELG